MGDVCRDAAADCLLASSVKCDARMEAVGSKLMPQEARVAVDRERLKSRRHELARATRLAEASRLVECCCIH